MIFKKVGLMILNLYNNTVSTSYIYGAEWNKKTPVMNK